MNTNMRIVVPIKQVPETSNVKMDPETGTMIRTDVEAIVNPLDLYAIEAALRLRQQVGGEVTTLSMGPPSAVKALREAIAMGCDDGILLSDKQFAGSDTWATSYALAQAIKKIGVVDLIICGERATDGDTGQVGPGIAAFLDLPVATYVSRIYDLSAGGLRVERLVEGGAEILWLPLPAVLTVVKEIAYPRLPTLRGKQRARRTELPVWKPADIGARVEWLGLQGSPTRVVKIDKPQVARQGELIRVKDPADVDRAAARLVEFLQERHLIVPRDQS
jgi:electron transfer flavoprotein beta subunit